MIIKCEMELWKFKAWSGGKAVIDRLTIEECDQLESILEDIYPDGMDEESINDLLWFDTEWVLEVLNIDEDDFWKREIKPF